MTPKKMMAIMIRVVMTGRRMKMAAMFMSDRLPVASSGKVRATRNSQRCFHFHFTLRGQSDLSVGDDSLARTHALVDDRLLLHLLPDGHGAHLHGVPLLDHIDILPALSSLH